MAQLEFDWERPKEPDRNHRKGGKSFYFFDWDDNILFLSTPIYLFQKKTGEELAVSTQQFAQIGQFIGKEGPYEDYEISLDPRTGSFRRFRDHGQPSESGFLNDVMEVLRRPDFFWKGPSWKFFYHAVFNRRAMSIITARGHHPEAIQGGIELLVQEGHLSLAPNYLGVYPVNHPDTRMLLGDKAGRRSVAELKKEAIIRSVNDAMMMYGENPHHRFGMSDDDPENIELAVDAMRTLKKRYQENSFFVIHADRDPVEKIEVFVDHTETSSFPDMNQIELFDPDDGTP